MGTRSLTVIHDTNDDVILCMYRQYDGYPSGMGMDLKNFLKDAKLVNGYNGDDEKDTRTFNGMPDLAVRLVTFLKNEEAASKRKLGNYDRATGTYSPSIHPASGEDCIGQYYITKYTPEDNGWAEYIYHIRPAKTLKGFGVSCGVKLTCYDVYKKKNVSIKAEKNE